MDATTLVTQLLTGLAYGMLLFMISVGLSVIFGLMNVVNLAHGAFYVVGVYLAYTMLGAGFGFWLALLLGTLAVAVLGVLVERLLLSRSYGNELNEVLLTFGIAFILRTSDEDLLLFVGIRIWRFGLVFAKTLQISLVMYCLHKHT